MYGNKWFPNVVYNVGNTISMNMEIANTMMKQ